MSRANDSEKITINLGHVDLGRIDLLVRDGLYNNRADLIRTAIRNQLERHDDTLRQSMQRKQMEFGLRHLTRADIEIVRQTGQPITLNVVGLVSIDSAVTPELARQTIASIAVLGAFQASDAVKAALSDRLR